MELNEDYEPSLLEFDSKSNGRDALGPLSLLLPRQALYLLTDTRAVHGNGGSCCSHLLMISSASLRILHLLDECSESISLVSSTCLEPGGQH